MNAVVSVNGVPVRLTVERWAHIVENHDTLTDYRDDVLLTVSNPEQVVRGHGGALIARRKIGKRRHLLVVYKELGREDGFVITACFSLAPKAGQTVWPRR